MSVAGYVVQRQLDEECDPGELDEPSQRVETLMGKGKLRAVRFFEEGL